ncbi:MAG TPA: hypothetical protein VKV95_12350 [Terriglobia bacterium]|nr:hypothetical protein [Terriglobia bacterium]
MRPEFKRWLFSAALAGVLTAGVGTTGSRAQNPNEPPPGSRPDRREDRREIKRLRFQVNEDQQRLDADIRQFGTRSPQAREDRQRLRQDKHRLRQLQRDLRRDQAI